MAQDAIGIISKEKVTDESFKKGEHFAYKQITLASTARDSGNTPTTTLRRGLVLGKITASGKFAQYDNSATDGTQTADGVLEEQEDLVNEETNAAVDTQGVMMWHGRVSEASLIGIDSAGKTDLAGRFYFDA